MWHDVTEPTGKKRCSRDVCCDGIAAIAGSASHTLPQLNFNIYMCCVSGVSFYGTCLQPLADCLISKENVRQHSAAFAWELTRPR